MIYLKKYKIFEASNDSEFNRIFNLSKFGVIPNFDKLKIELNNINNNFDPNIIKDLFIDFIDIELIKDIEINKVYDVTKTTKTTKGIVKDAYYINYKIEVIFYLNNDFSDNFSKIREDYLKERNIIRKILEDTYEHRSLNSKLSKWNLKDTKWGYHEREGGFSLKFSNNKDYFDLHPKKNLWL